MNSDVNNSTYYFDWIEVGKRNRKLTNNRILLYGNIFMHEARYATMKACKCITDAIYTNKPLREVFVDLKCFLSTYTYSLVVLGEGVAWEKEANCEYLKKLQFMYPYTRFVLATCPSDWMQPKRYKEDNNCRLENNERCRAIAKELGIPCLDVASWADEMGLTSVEKAKNVKRLLVLSYLKQFRISKAFKACRIKAQNRNIMNMSAMLLSQKLAAEVRKLASKKAPTPEIVWKNKWQHRDAHALIIGDSNTRRLCRASGYLTEKVDMFATSAPMISVDTEEVICSMLKPRITHVCFSIGGHYLKCWGDADFEKRLKEFLVRLKKDNRKVMLLTLTDWADRENLSMPDVQNNKLIDILNYRMKKVANDVGVDIMDFYDIMKDNPHEDYIHFVQSAYNKPASMIVDWFTS